METLLPRKSPSAVGVDAGCIIDFLKEIQEKGLELHSLMIVKNGSVIAEGWWYPYTSQRYHGCYSVTKAFVSTAVGLAEEEGLLSLDDYLADFFPEKLPNHPSQKLLEIRVRDLLRMSCGMPKEVSLIGVADSVQAFLAEEVADQPGGKWRYNSICTHMLSQIVEKVSGMSIEEYLTPRLFEPLGISNYRWDRNPQGEIMGGWGIHITTETLAKMGQLYLQKGKWGEKQLIPESWVERASACQIDNSDPEHPKGVSDFGSGYGYQLWNCLEEGSFRLDGAFGQVSMVFPKDQLVIAITEGVSDAQKTFDVVRKHLIHGVQEGKTRSSQQDDQLREMLSSLTLGENKAAPRSSMESEINHAVYQFEKNEGSLIPETQRWMAFVTESGISRMSLSFEKKEGRLSWTEGAQNYEVSFGLDGDYRYSVTQLPYCENVIASCGYWEAENVLHLIFRMIEEAHGMEIKIQLEKNQAILSYQPTITKTPWVSLTGIRSDHR